MLLVALAVAVTMLAASTSEVALPARRIPPPGSGSRGREPAAPAIGAAAGFTDQVRDARPPSADAQPAHTHDVKRGCRAAPAGAHRTAASSAWGPARSNSHGPFDRTTGVGGTAEFTVGARRIGAAVPVSQAPAVEAGQAAEIDGLLPTLIRGQGTEFDSLRAVCRRRRRPLDRWRRASARRADHGPHLAARNRTAVVIVPTPDAWRRGGSVSTDRRRSRQVARLDWSMDAALLAALASRTGDHVDFLAPRPDQQPRRRVGASRSELR